MNLATKNILKATLAVYNSEKEKGKIELLEYMQKKLIEYRKVIKEIGAYYAENEAQAAEIFLRMYKPKMKKEKHDKTVNHSQRAHALLSASGASRWIACTPSPRLEENFENRSSAFAEEGTLAHEFAELNLKRDLKLIKLPAYKKEILKHLESEHYSSEMEDYVQKHIDYVIEQFTEAKKRTKDAVLLIETKVDITHLIEEGFGTCDNILIADGVLEVIDLKYGMGVRVSAENNKQLMLYASGALEVYEMLYDIHTVKLTITQPRLDSISSWEISAEDLRTWGEEIVKPAAIKAYAGEGEQITGDHCQFCRASAKCRAQADLALQTAKEDFPDPQLLSGDELIAIYKKIPNIDAWFKKVNSFLFEEALAGKKWPEHKLVAGQNRRSWTKDSDVVKILSEQGYGDASFLNEPKLKGITDIEKLVGKKIFPTILSEVVMFKKTSPSLVHESDKRPELGLNQTIADFSEDL